MRIRTNSISKPPSPVVDTVNKVPTIAFAAKSKNKLHLILEQMEKDKNLTVKERFDIFISETSFTALTKIVKAGTVVKQIIWLVLVLAMMAWLCIQCYWLFDKYFQYPYEVKIELESPSKMEFPSVTICNRNPIRQSKYRGSPFFEYHDTFSLKKDSSLYDKAVKMMRNGSDTLGEFDGGDGEDSEEEEARFFRRQMRNQSFDVWSALDDPTTAAEFYKKGDPEIISSFVYASIATTIESDELKSYGHQINDLLTSCIYMGQQCSPENFTYVPSVKYGNCFTFNAFNNSKPALYTSYAGPLMGLVLELNVQQHEYKSALAPDAGVRVLVHSRGTFPAVEDDGFSIPVGFVTSVGLGMTEISRLPPPHASCATHGEVENLYQEHYGVIYEKSTCIKSCQQMLWKEKCGCVLAIYESPANTTRCNVEDHDEHECITKQSNEMEECETKCPSPCYEKKIEPLISMGTWPSKKYEEYLDFKLMHTSLDFMNDNEKPESDENLAKLKVYFRELIVQKIQQQKAYESQNLISDVGGQLGLWLGLSAITIGEMVEFFMAVFKAVTAKAVRRRPKGSTVDSLEDRDRKLSLQDFQ